MFEGFEDSCDFGVEGGSSFSEESFDAEFFKGEGVFFGGDFEDGVPKEEFFVFVGHVGGALGCGFLGG